jgi:hypothetical protein
MGPPKVFFRVAGKEWLLGLHSHTRPAAHSLVSISGIIALDGLTADHAGTSGEAVSLHPLCLHFTQILTAFHGYPFKVLWRGEAGTAGF